MTPLILVLLNLREPGSITELENETFKSLEVQNGSSLSKANLEIVLKNVASIFSNVDYMLVVLGLTTQSFVVGGFS